MCWMEPTSLSISCIVVTMSNLWPDILHMNDAAGRKRKPGGQLIPQRNIITMGGNGDIQICSPKTILNVPDSSDSSRFLPIPPRRMDQLRRCSVRNRVGRGHLELVRHACSSFRRVCGRIQAEPASSGWPSLKALTGGLVWALAATPRPRLPAFPGEKSQFSCQNR